ncbi:hypothetical protein RhiirB3_434272 [Rhizophagus irregularis]|nr:hypothetical protein RhiirB3_434272 [Rhizophagus irregularis]
MEMDQHKINYDSQFRTIAYVVELTPSILVSYISQSTLSIHDKTCLFLYVYAPWSLHAVAYINSGVLQEIAKRYHSYDSNIEITAMEIYEPNDIVEKHVGDYYWGMMVMWKNGHRMRVCWGKASIQEAINNFCYRPSRSIFEITTPRTPKVTVT